MGVDLSKQAIWWASTLASKQSDGWRLLTARCLLATGFCRHALWPCDCKTDSDCDAKGKLLRIQRDANVSYLSERQKQKVNMRACILGRQMHLGVVNVVARGAGRWWRWIRIVNHDPLVCRFYYYYFISWLWAVERFLWLYNQVAFFLFQIPAAFLSVSPKLNGTLSSS